MLLTVATTGLMMSVSVALLLPAAGSVVPLGTVAVAVLTMVPVAAGVPVTLKVTEPPLGRVGTTMPVPCIKAMVVFAALGQTAPPVAVPQVTAVTVRPAAVASLKTLPLAGLGPLLVITMV